MRVLGYLGLLAALVIISILFVTVARSMLASSPQVETGSQRAAREMSEPGEERMDPQAEIRATIRDSF